MTNIKSVGYKKPPAANRFKPGQSGNTKGRPKRPILTAIAVIVRTVLFEEHSVLIGDDSVRKTAWEIILLRLHNRAMGGDHRAMALVFALKKRIQDWKKKNQKEECGFIVVLPPKPDSAAQ